MQSHRLIDLCIECLIKALVGSDNKTTVRLHRTLRAYLFAVRNNFTIEDFKTMRFRLRLHHILRLILLTGNKRRKNYTIVEGVSVGCDKIAPND